MRNIFDAAVTQELTERINLLSPASRPLWGKMAVGQMLAHCNVLYEMVYTTVHPKPNAFKRFVLRMLVKTAVVNEKTYKHHTRTAPWFIIHDNKEFHEEKSRLVAYVAQTQTLGPSYFNNKEYHSLGKLTATEWNNMFYKHLDHHLRQFGV